MYAASGSKSWMCHTVYVNPAHTRRWPAVGLEGDSFLTAPGFFCLHDSDERYVKPQSHTHPPRPLNSSKAASIPENQRKGTYFPDHLTQCRFDAGPPSTTLAQHQIHIVFVRVGTGGEGVETQVN